MLKKHDPSAASEKITPTAFEVSVAKSGFLKPYIACFSSLPDNIAREPLGMLAGVFSIRDHSESSAYIVNFLSSLAKKEYYANHRRSVIESFEACLHKINLGLSELAREGNTEWIGTLDAAILAIEKNNLHFSVAGNAHVLLFRDQRLSIVSEGLATAEELHPMKTFTDVASGKVCSGDRIIATTPEIFSILPEAELERSAIRLSNDGFERFLRTAIVNQLDCAASILISIQATEEYRRPLAPQRQRTLASPGLVPNAWSLSTFEQSKQTGTSVKAGLEERQTTEQEKERIDNKTGHIYVTGDTPKEITSERWEHAHDIFHNIRHALSQFERTCRFECSRLLEVTRKIASLLAQKIRESWEEWRMKRSSNPTADNYQEALQNKEDASRTDSHSDQNPRKDENLTPPFIRIILFRLVAKAKNLSEYLPTTSLPLRIPVRDGESRIQKIAEAFRHVPVLIAKGAHISLIPWRSLSGKNRLIVVGVSIAILSGIVVASMFRAPADTKTDAQLPATSMAATGNPPPGATRDGNVHSVEIGAPITIDGNIVSLESLGENFFLSTKTSIFRVNERERQAIALAIPSRNEIAHISAMRDINTLFIFGRDGSLSLYTPANNRFRTEQSPFEEGRKASSIAASTTYLYTLDPESRSIRRFPRVEGGFGAGSSWLKEAAEITFDTKLAVGTYVYLSGTNSIKSYSRGIERNIPFEVPTAPAVFSDLSIGESDSSLFALDSASGRIIEYDTGDGSIVAQYTSDFLKGARAISIQAKGGSHVACAAKENQAAFLPLDAE